MAKETITKVVATCDRCGKEGDTGDSNGRSEWGELNIGWRGDYGSRTYAGDAAGHRREGKAWLCMSCGNEFREFMKG